jgi:hypothetical protein
VSWQVLLLCCALAVPAAAQETLLDDGRWRVVGVAGLGVGNAAAPQIAVSVAGAPAGAFAALRFAYAREGGFDEVLVLRGDGSIEPALPGGVAGGSASLGRYWDCERGLIGPLRFVSLELPQRSRQSGRLHLRGRLSNLDSLESEKLELRIRTPKPERVRVELRYGLRATRELCIDRDRRDTVEEFRVVELAASFLGSGLHTNDLARYVKDLRFDCDFLDCDVEKVTFCAPLANETGYVIDRPRRLEDRVLSLFHTSSAPEPTPSLELELRSPHPHRLKPQGFVTESSNPAERNVAFWADWVDVRGRYGAGRKLANFRFALEAEPPRRPGCDRRQD